MVNLENKNIRKITIRTLLMNPQRVFYAFLSKLTLFVFRFRNLFLRANNKKPFAIYPVIYIRTPKCASSSIIESFAASKRLIRIHGRLDKVKKDELSEENIKRKVIFISPGNIKWMQKKYPSIWNNSFKFSVVRNPYSKVVSAWKFLDDLKEKELKDVLASPPKLESWRNYHHFTRTITSMLLVENKLCTDYVIKYENLNEDFKYILEVLGVNNMQLPNVNKTYGKNKNENKHILDKDVKTQIQNLYHDDFVNFGYEK